jgi:hypothetical protein
MSEPTDWAAWVGAISGCGALLVQFLAYIYKGPRVKLSVARNMTLQPPPRNGGGVNVFTVITATNVGDANTTITHLYLKQSSNFWNRIRGKWKSAVMGPNPFVKIPDVVEPGKQWQALWPEEMVNELCKPWQYNYICLQLATKKRPVQVRVFYRADVNTDA